MAILRASACIPQRPAVLLCTYNTPSVPSPSPQKNRAHTLAESTRCTKRAEVLFSEQQYRKLLEIAKKRHKSIAALLREAAETMYLKDEQSRRKTEAVQSLFSLEETEAPEEYQHWEQQYLNEKCLHAED